MAVNNYLIGIGASYALALIVGGAKAAERIRNHSRAIREVKRELKELQREVKELDGRFVPREVVDAKLQRIEDLVSRTNSMVSGQVLGSDRLGVRSIEAVATPMRICHAIAHEEGYGIPGDRATRNNNPGNIEYAHWCAAEFGAVLETPIGTEIPRFARFPNEVLGYAAMVHLLQSDEYRGLTIHQALNKWAPPVENNTSSYEANVCLWTGLRPSTVIDSYLL